jgi:hypothetical protein
VACSRRCIGWRATDDTRTASRSRKRILVLHLYPRIG